MFILIALFVLQNKDVWTMTKTLLTNTWKKRGGKVGHPEIVHVFHILMKDQRKIKHVLRTI